MELLTVTRVDELDLFQVAQYCGGGKAGQTGLGLDQDRPSPRSLPLRSHIVVRLICLRKHPECYATNRKACLKVDNKPSIPNWSTAAEQKAFCGVKSPYHAYSSPAAEKPSDKPACAKRHSDLWLLIGGNSHGAES